MDCQNLFVFSLCCLFKTTFIFYFHWEVVCLYNLFGCLEILQPTKFYTLPLKLSFFIKLLTIVVYLEIPAEACYNIVELLEEAS